MRSCWGTLMIEIIDSWLAERFARFFQKSFAKGLQKMVEDTGIETQYDLGSCLLLVRISSRYSLEPHVSIFVTVPVDDETVEWVEVFSHKGNTTHRFNYQRIWVDLLWSEIRRYNAKKKADEKKDREERFKSLT